MKDDKKIFAFLTLVAVLMVALTIGTVSYAYFTASIEEGDIYSLKGKAKYDPELKISFTETNEGVSLTNTYPMTDAMGLQLDPYTFTVKNEETDKTLNISVILEVLNTSTLVDNLVNVGIDNEIKTLNSDISTTASESQFRSAYEVYSFELNANESKTINLRTWINATGTIDNAQNKTWSSRVLVVPGEKLTAAESLVAKANDATVTDYNSGNKGEMFTFEHPATEQTEALTDYRYIGSSPNNYIDFNDETWRIIGVFTVETESGEKEQLMKIIRDESIGKLPWDMKSDKTYINEWSTASLKTFLNGEYYNTEGSFTTTYYNSSGTAQTLSIPKGLSSTARSQVANVKWYLGGSSTVTGLGGPDYYAFERGTTVYSGRSTNIIAKVGLMYPSDYVYTYANGVDNKCYTDGYNCSSGTPANGWLYKSGTVQWTVSPYVGVAFNAFYVYTNGYVLNGNIVNYYTAVRPTVFLASDVAITSGDGSSSNHYKLG